MFHLHFFWLIHRKKAINLLYERIIAFCNIRYCLFFWEVLLTDLMILLKYNT